MSPIDAAWKILKEDVENIPDWYYDFDMYRDLITGMMQQGMSLPAALRQIGEDYMLSPTDLAGIRQSYEAGGTPYDTGA